MPNFIRKTRLVLSNLKTYQIGLLQAKAFRVLKHRTGEALEPFGITTTEWAFLGMLFDRPDGIRSGEAAEELGVEAPFVTRIVQSLQKRGFIETKSSADDSRVKVLCLTRTGSTFVTKTEPVIRAAVRVLATGISRGDLLGYVSALDTIAKNEPKNNPTH